MKTICTGALAAALLLAQTAYADPEARAAGFRSPQPTPFTQEEIADLQLDAQTAAKVDEYREAGYRIAALSEDELEAQKAGLSSTTWVIIGVVALVVIVAAADGGGGGGY